MKIKHLKTKTTIELTPEEMHEWVRRINEIDSMLTSYAEMQDVYMSDVRNLESTKYRLVSLFDLEWSREQYKYIRGQS
jgi:hypothetical protein